jgi:hypothetical protein
MFHPVCVTGKDVTVLYGLEAISTNNGWAIAIAGALITIYEEYVLGTPFQE